MSEYGKAILAVVIAAMTSTTGTISIRLADDFGNLTLAIIGGSLWCLSGAGFVYASSKGLDLGLIATAMSAVSLITINIAGLVWFGDVTTPRRLIGLILIVISMFLIVWPTTNT
jgi:multidrug transporter EmrE-like cation transporter